jgi:aminomethyltransferase
MTASWRFSTLADRHRALGSKLEDWSGMGTAWTYDKDADEEYVAIRTKAGLMDVSGLKKVHIAGPHASHLIDLATTRDVEKIYPGKSAYACMLNEQGKFTDDCILYRTGPNAWMVVHGSGTGHEELQRASVGRDVSLRFDDNLHDLSLQGPTSVDYLAKHVPGIRDLAYFHHMQTQLFGFPVMISRTGYTGDLGYELWLDAERASAERVWDALIAAGRSFALQPAGIWALDVARIEAGLIMLDVDYTPANKAMIDSQASTPLELGLEWAVSWNKGSFVGRNALLEEKRHGVATMLVGLELDHVAFARQFNALGLPVAYPFLAWRSVIPLHADGAQVGYTTSGVWSPTLKKYIMLAHLQPGHAAPGSVVMIELNVDRFRRPFEAKVTKLPFFNPDRKKL